MTLPPIWLMVGGGALALLALQEIRVQHYKGDATEAQEELEHNRLLAQLEKSDIEDEWRRKYDELDEAGEADRKLREERLGVADAARVGLLRDIERYRKANRSCPSPGGTDVPADDPIGVFARLLNGTDRLAGVYAKTANDWRAVATACEARYEVILHSGSSQK